MKKTIALSALAIFIILSGCASSKTNELLLKSGMAHALIEQPAMAKEFNRVSTEALTFIGVAEAVSMTDLKTFILDRVTVNGMLEEDKALLKEAVDGYADEWYASLGIKDLTPAQQIVKAKDFLTWVQTTSAKYLK